MFPTQVQDQAPRIMSDAQAQYLLKILGDAILRQKYAISQEIKCQGKIRETKPVKCCLMLESKNSASAFRRIIKSTVKAKIPSTTVPLIEYTEPTTKISSLSLTSLVDSGMMKKVAGAELNQS